MSALDFGYPGASVRTRLLSLRVHLRAVTSSTLLLGVAVLIAVVAIRFGDYPLTLAEVAGALTGDRGDAFHRVIVVEWRLPVAVAAVLFGALLGIGGAIFQSLTRNPLGSPDVIGFDAGAYTAVVVTMLVLGRPDYWTTAVAAIAGGLFAAMLVYVLAYRQGIQGFRMIIVGIGIAALFGSVNAYLITRAEVVDAMSVGFWGAGSIGRVSWQSMAPAMLLAVVILTSTALLAPWLQSLELGDDAAVTHGTPVTKARLALMIVGVATTALVTAAAGPIGFIALVAPQLARRLTGAAGVSLLTSAAMGAMILSAAHLLSLLVAQLYRPVPVGLITVVLGGAYLIWLLIRESRHQFGAF